MPLPNGPLFMIFDIPIKATIKVTVCCSTEIAYYTRTQEYIPYWNKSGPVPTWKFSAKAAS